MRTLLVTLLALLPVPVAGAVGPWLGTSTDGVGYSVVAAAETTTVSHAADKFTLDGSWGLPRVTLNGAVGGLSPDGGTLVLAAQVPVDGTLRTKTDFAILATSPLRLRRIVHLRGDFGFDALSPGGRTLYLIQHVSRTKVFDYRVRAYDLRTNRLLSRVIADKRQRHWLMNGFPVSRATSPDGRWVYTLYSNADNYPFVHALDTMSRTAVCIGLPWDWKLDEDAIVQSKLRLAGGKLIVGSRFTLDRATFKVTAR